MLVVRPIAYRVVVISSILRKSAWVQVIILEQHGTHEKKLLFKVERHGRMPTKSRIVLQSMADARVEWVRRGSTTLHHQAYCHSKTCSVLVMCWAEEGSRVSVW